MKTRISLLSKNARMPKRAHESDTGYDITFTGVLKVVGDVIFFKTDIAVQPEKGHYFEVVPRSSISKQPLGLANSVGIIDEHYTGEIIVPVRVFHEHQGGFVKQMDRFPAGLITLFGQKVQSIYDVGQVVLAEQPCMFQLILRQRLDTEFVVSDLGETDRGDGGFGSTLNREPTKDAIDAFKKSTASLNGVIDKSVMRTDESAFVPPGESFGYDSGSISNKEPTAEALAKFQSNTASLNKVIDKSAMRTDDADSNDQPDDGKVRVRRKK